MKTYATATSGHDPVLLEHSVWAGRRFKSWASYADVPVPRSAHTDSLAAQVAAGGGTMAVVAATGDHGDATHFDPAAYVSFLDSSFAAGPAALSPTAVASSSEPLVGFPNQGSGSTPFNADATGTNVILPAGNKRSVGIVNTGPTIGFVSFDRGASWGVLAQGRNIFNEVNTSEAVYVKSATGLYASGTI